MSLLPGPNSKRSFVLQQGFSVPGDPETESNLFFALQVQPRFIGCLILAGVALRSPFIFLIAGVVMWFSAIVPRWNPFNALYNHALGKRRGVFLLMSPPPRMFSEALAGSLALGIALLFAAGHTGVAMLLAGFFALANSAVVFSRFCVGASLFAWLSRRPDIHLPFRSCSRSAPMSTRHFRR